MVQGTMKCVKYLLFVSNLLFVVAGIVLISLGVITNHTFAQFGTIVKTTNLTLPSTLFIVAGAIVFVIAFLGCCGAVKENHCMMMTYSVLIGLLLVVQLVAAVTAYYREDDVKGVFTQGMNEALKKYGEDNAEGEEIRKTWDFIQKDFKCCGSNNYTDWFGVTPFNASMPIIPESCCQEETAGCTADITEAGPKPRPGVLWEKGCADKAVDAINIGKIGSAGIGLAVIEVLAVVLACFMARSIRYSYETV